MSTKLRLAALLVAGAGVISVGSHHAAAFSWFQLSGVNVVWVPAESVRFLSPTTFPPDSEIDLLYRGAMGLWNLVPAATFEFFFARNQQDFPIDNFDGFSDTIALPAASLDPGVLGVTFMVNSGAQWFDMDMVFSDFPSNTGWTLDPAPDCNAVANPMPSNGFSFLLVATHELGHALGLGHDPIGNEPPGTGWFVATMNPAYPAGGPVGDQHIVELHTDDRNGVRFLYPHSGPAAPPMIDLAVASYGPGASLGKVEPLAFSPAAAFPGDELTLRSIIENFGTTSEFFVRQGFYLSTDTTIDTSDVLLGEVRWDLAFEDAIEFDVILTLPDDIAAGTYWLGSFFDDLNEIVEAYEDNNIHRYCAALTIGQLAPEIEPLAQEVTTCEQPYVGPRPTLTKPLNMKPVTWSLDDAPAGMTINANTGRVRWNDPAPSTFLYAITIRATNSAGFATQTLFLGVDRASPQIEPIPDDAIACGTSYVGPTPVLTNPGCMGPILNWSLDAGPAGMSIDFATGVVSWPSAVPSETPQAITIRATNAVGNGSQTWNLSVSTIFGDVDFSGAVGLSDLAIVLGGFGACTGDAAFDLGADLNGNGCVDLSDLAGLLAVFGSSCP